MCGGVLKTNVTANSQLSRGQPTLKGGQPTLKGTANSLPGDSQLGRSRLVGRFENADAARALPVVERGERELVGRFQVRGDCPPIRTGRAARQPQDSARTCTAAC